MRKPYKVCPLNEIFISGFVTDVKEGLLNDKHLYIKARIEIEAKGKRNTAVDVIGIGDNADLMSLVCKEGNYVFVEAMYSSNEHIDNFEGTYLLVRRIERLYMGCKRLEKPEIKAISVLDVLDPKNYLGEGKPPKARKKRTYEDGDD